MNEFLAESNIDAIKGFINRISEPGSFFVLTCAALAVLLIGYRQLTKPTVAGILALLFVGFFVASSFDHNFFLIISKPDNVPIVIMIFILAFLTWLALRQAAVNDARMEKGEPLIEAGSDDKVLVWPDLVYIELIALTLCSALLIVWAVVLRAPLEQPADPNVAPNPAKAPWYFLGLQELLVYFDPWIAGVLLPGLIIAGLAALPYVDRNPRGNGYYTFKERRFAISVYMFGWGILWVVLIIFGTFLRGPNWGFFGPYEYWDPHRPEALLNIDLRDIFWVQMLGQGLPENMWIREAPGIVLILAYFLLLPALLKKTLFRGLYPQLGGIRYGIMMFMLLWMLLVPIKMVLRWTLNLHYIVAMPELFNI